MWRGMNRGGGVILRVQVILLLFLALCRTNEGGAQTNLTCIICGKGPLVGKVWVHKRGHICSDCYQLETRCSLCGLPVREGFAKTTDGRIICQFDLPNTVLSVDEGKRIFNETLAGIRQMSGSALQLKQTNIAVNVFDVDYWNVRDGQPVPEKLRRTGFSQTRHTGNQFTHAVILLSGQLKSDMVSVCAHEFTHLWINENKAASRTLDGDTVEALCELVAYKLAVQNANSDQQDRIKKNTYTNGKIETLIEVDLQYGLNPILDWVKNGTDQLLDLSKLAQFRTGAIVAAFRALPSLPAPAPNTLLLRGIFGKGKNRLALINDHSFAKLDEERVRVGSQMVLVQCLDILDQSVVIRVNASEPVTLWLNGR